MLAGVSTTGARLEIAFVVVGFFLVAESDGGFEVPRSIFSCVRNLSGVVAGEAFVEILSHACIMVLPGGDITENVDVVKAGGGHGGGDFGAFEECGVQRGCGPPSPRLRRDSLRFLWCCAP